LPYWYAANGTFVPDLSDAPPGTKVSPINVTRGPNGDINASMDFHVGPKPADNESQTNSTGNLTNSSSTNTTNTFNATIPSESDWHWEYLTPVTKYSQAWNSGSEYGFLGEDWHLHGQQHTLDFFYGYVNGTETIWTDRGYADGLSGLHKWTHFIGNPGHKEEEYYSDGYQAGM
jgi:hypothetical protein